LKTFAIIVPVYNEEDIIQDFFSVLLKAIKKIDTKKYKTRIIFINNGSTDKSIAFLKKLYNQNNNVSVLTLSKNFGYQNSLYFALKNIKADIYNFIDIDCEDPPLLINNFIKKYEEGFDIVYGERVDRHEFFILKKARNQFYKIVKLLADDEIILYMAEFCLISREVRNAVIDEVNSFPFIRSNISRVGFNSFGIKYKRDKRIGGKTHYNILSMIVFATAGILTSSTIFLRLPIYFLFLASLFLIINMFNDFFDHQYVFNFLIYMIYFTVSFMAIYVARIYKNQFLRPNAYLYKKNTFIGCKDFFEFNE